MIESFTFLSELPKGCRIQDNRLDLSLSDSCVLQVHWVALKCSCECVKMHCCACFIQAFGTFRQTCQFFALILKTAAVQRRPDVDAKLVLTGSACLMIMIMFHSTTNPIYSSSPVKGISLCCSSSLIMHHIWCRLWHRLVALMQLTCKWSHRLSQ